MEPIAKYLLENVSNARVRRSVNRAFNALFEGLTPQQKTRRAIRGMLPEPPGGWDSPAMDADGNQRFTAENGRPMTYAEALEYNIRNTFFHDGGRSNPRFEPGVARIAYKELGLWPDGLSDWAKGQRPATTDTASAGRFARILREISASHADDYDSDLNGMWWMEIYAQFAHGSTGEKYVNEEADGTGSKYRVVWIRNFDEAKQYGRYTEDTQQWCLTEFRRYWNQYTKGNTVKMYFLISPDVDEVEPVPGPNAPLDEYGLSLIGVGIAPDGTLDNCCTRWNHMHGGSDMALDEKGLCRLLNVRELSDVCPPFSDEDRKETRGKLMDLVDMVRKGESTYGHKVREVQSFGNVRVYEIPMGAGENYRIVLNDKLEPILDYPVYDEKVYGGYSMLAKYDPYAFDGHSDEDDEEDPGTCYAIIRHDGKAGWAEEDVTYREIFYENPDAAPREGINYGRAYVAHEEFGDNYLYNVGVMDWWDSSVNLEDIAGNLFMNGGELMAILPDGPKVLQEGLADYSDQCIIGDHCAGMAFASHDDDLYRYAFYDTLTGECMLTRDFITAYDNILGKNAVRLEYRDDTTEVLDRNGKPVLGPMTDESCVRAALYTRSEDGRVHRQHALVDSEHRTMLCCDYVTGKNGGRLDNPHTVKIPGNWPMDKGIKLAVGDAGFSAFVSKTEETEGLLYAPDDSVFGPYDEMGHAWVMLLLYKVLNDDTAMYSERTRIVNVVDFRTGKPYLDQDMEKTMFEHLLRAVVCNTPVGEASLALEFETNGGGTRTYTLSVPGGFREIPQRWFDHVLQQADAENIVQCRKPIVKR